MCIFFFCTTGVRTQGLHLEPLYQHFFVKSFVFFFLRDGLTNYLLRLASNWDPLISAS
jgi:hypothetical protein